MAPCFHAENMHLLEALLSWSDVCEWFTLWNAEEACACKHSDPEIRFLLHVIPTAFRGDLNTSFTILILD